MMRRIISLLLVFSLFAAPARANLGETVKQCIARYGRPNGYSEAGPKSPFGTVVFVAGGFVLVLFIYQEKEVGARVSKADKSAFSDADMQSIMDADTAGSSWTSIKSDDPTCLAWQRGDKAKVLYDKIQHMLIFSSPAMMDVLHGASAGPASAGLSSSNAAATNSAPVH